MSGSSAESDDDPIKETHMGDEIVQVEGAGAPEVKEIDRGSDDAALRSHMASRKSNKPDQNVVDPKADVVGDPVTAVPKDRNEKPNKGKAQQVIGKLTRHVSDLKAERDELLSRIEALKAKPAPDAKDFANDRDFDRALIRHETELSYEQKALQTESARIENKTREDWDARCNEQVKDMERFTSSYPSVYNRLQSDPMVKQVIANSHYAPAIIEALMENVYDGGAREQGWMRMSPHARAQEVIKFEQALALSPSTEPEPEPVVSKAPKAPSIEGKPASAPSHKNDDDAMKSYMRNRRGR